MTWEWKQGRGPTGPEHVLVRGDQIVSRVCSRRHQGQRVWAAFLRGDPMPQIHGSLLDAQRAVEKSYGIEHAQGR